jgi:hypothetical protein
MRYLKTVTTLVAVALAVGARTMPGQTGVSDASARLRQVLPADVAARVLAVIAKARAQQLPTEALENRALKFAAKGVRPDSIERSVVEHESRMERAKGILEEARGRAAGDEVEAAAEAMRKGVDGQKVAELAKSAPSGRSLAVPLYVIGSLMDRGLPSTTALRRVEDGLKARATDRDLEQFSADAQGQNGIDHGNKPAETGRDLAETKRPGNAAGAQNGNGNGPPASVPGNGGAGAKPTSPPGQANKPTTPPGKKP